MAVGQLSFLLPSITGLSSMFRGLANQESDEGIAYNESVIAQYTAKLNDYQSKVEHLTQPTFLYFNLKDYFKLNALLSEWQSLMDGLGTKGAAYQSLVDQYVATPTPELDAASDTAFDAVKEQINLIADSLDRFAATMQETIYQIKGELSLFDAKKGIA